MQRFSDEEILGVYVPRGLGPPIGDGEQISCARLRCAHIKQTTGMRAHRWAARQLKRPAIELCPRCHLELATIMSGG